MVVKLAVLRGLGSRSDIVDKILASLTDSYLEKVGGGKVWGEIV